MLENRRFGWVALGAAGVVALGALLAERAPHGAPEDRRAAVRVAPEPRGREAAVLTAPPAVPPRIERDYATTVVVNLEVIEKEMEIAPGTTYEFWTFGGTVPGSFIRVREGDRVVFNLSNAADSELPHNIDLHAVTGPGGGAAASVTLPGQTSTFEFTALNPGLYVYHCAMPGMIATHIANGMYGLIHVDDADAPLPEVDREFYLMQGEFYTRGRHGEPGLQPLDFGKALAEQPEYVVFNGRVGAHAGEHALRARKGETVRLFVGNGGPNLTSSFHVIGEIFDNVYGEAGSAVTHDVQTTLVPAGGAAVVEFALETSGAFHFLDHAIFRATQKGALGTISVEGEPDPAVFEPDGDPPAR